MPSSILFLQRVEVRTWFSIVQWLLAYHFQQRLERSKCGTVNKIQNYILAGLQLYDRVGTLVFESAMQIVFNCPSYHYIVTVLKEGERIVGIKSHTPDAKLAVHDSF